MRGERNLFVTFDLRIEASLRSLSLPRNQSPLLSQFWISAQKKSLIREYPSSLHFADVLFFCSHFWALLFERQAKKMDLFNSKTGSGSDFKDLVSESPIDNQKHCFIRSKFSHIIVWKFYVLKKLMGKVYHFGFKKGEIKQILKHPSSFLIRDLVISLFSRLMTCLEANL